MSAIQVVSSHHAETILDVVVDEGFQGLVSFHGPYGWRAYKCGFHSRDRHDGIIGLTTVGMMSVQGAPALGATLGVSFRYGHKKCMFRAVLERFDTYGDEQIARLKWSGELRQLQRRAYERAAPPRGVVIPVRFRLEENAGRTASSDRETRHGQLENISAGGMRIKTGASNDVRIGATYRCIMTIRPGTHALIIDAVLRHADPDRDGRVSLGFQFVGMESTPEGEKLLSSIAQIVSRFKRARARNTRTAPHTG